MAYQQFETGPEEKLTKGCALKFIIIILVGLTIILVYKFGKLFEIF